MKKVKSLQENGFYVLEGINCANTHLVENQCEVDQFLIFANAYFRDYMTIFDYCITPVGWNLVVRIKSSKMILNTYETIQTRRSKEVKLHKVGLIISNQVRLFRSRMTKWTNAKRGREGNASKTVYSRYIFDSLAEAKSYIEKVRNQELELGQRNTRYQPNTNHFDQDGEIMRNPDKLSSRTNQDSSSVGRIYLECLKIYNYIVERLEKWIFQTLEKHKYRFEKRSVVVYRS